MREDEIYRLLPRGRMLAIICNVLGIVSLTGAVFLWPTNIPQAHFITLGLGIVGGVLLVVGILFHISDSLRHKGRIRQLERQWAREHRPAEQEEEQEDGSQEPEVGGQDPER